MNDELESLAWPTPLSRAWRQRANPTNQICRRRSSRKRICLRRRARGSAMHRHDDLPDLATPSLQGRARNPGHEMGWQPLIQCRLPSRRHRWAGCFYLYSANCTTNRSTDPPPKSTQHNTTPPKPTSGQLQPNGKERRQQQQQTNPRRENKKRRKKDVKNNPPRNMPLQIPLLLPPAPTALRPAPHGLLLPLHLLPARHWRAAHVRRRLARPCG